MRRSRFSHDDGEDRWCSGGPAEEMARWSFSGQGSSSAPSSDADLEVDDMEAAIRRRRPIKPGLLGTGTQRSRKFTHWGRNLSTRPDKPSASRMLPAPSFLRWPSAAPAVSLSGRSSVGEHILPVRVFDE